MATTYTPLPFGNRILIIGCDQETGAASITTTLTEDDIPKPADDATAPPTDAPETEPEPV